MHCKTLNNRCDVHGSSKMTTRNGCPMSQWEWHALEPLLVLGHECRVYVKLWSFSPVMMISPHDWIFPEKDATPQTYKDRMVNSLKHIWYDRKKDQRTFTRNVDMSIRFCCKLLVRDSHSLQFSLTLNYWENYIYGLKCNGIIQKCNDIIQIWPFDEVNLQMYRPRTIAYRPSTSYNDIYILLKEETDFIEPQLLRNI